ncbi:MAG: signal recognition particle-docking protein FtsY [Actinomycetes bacterium]|jgi:fused signal recognition particle receptor
MDPITLLVIVALVATVTAIISLVTYSKRSSTSDELVDQAPVAAPPAAGRSVGADEGTASPPAASRSSADHEASVLEEEQLPVAKPEVLAPVEPDTEQSRMQRLRSRLSGKALGRSLATIFSGDRIDESVWSELQDSLIIADVGVESSEEIVATVRELARSAGVAAPQDLRDILRSVLIDAINPSMDRSINISRSGQEPAVVMVVGVNGTGKTTTTGKLASLLVSRDLDVLLGAADTFRAAAAEQLATWGERVGVPTVRGQESSDPASVAFEAVKAGIENEVDVVILDTAGRLHTKTSLMDELSKVKRVVEKQSPVTEVLLVIDATTGQNGLAQARIFTDAVNVTGVALTKLDGSAKGGIIIAIQRELGVPVKLVGLGEGADDLAPFEVVTFVDELIGS